MYVQQMHSLVQFWNVCVNCKHISWERGNLERMRSLCIINPPYASLLPYSPQEKHFRKGYFIIYIPIVKTGKWSTDMVWGTACSFSGEGKKNWDTTGWKTKLRFIKSTVFKGGEIRDKNKRKLTYNIFFYYHPQHLCDITDVKLATWGLSCSSLEEIYFLKLWKLQGKRPNFIFLQQEYWACCPGPQGILCLQVNII